MKPDPDEIEPDTLEELEAQRKRRIQQQLLDLNGPGTTPEVQVNKAPPSGTKSQRMTAAARVAQNLLRSTRPRKS